MDRMVGFDTPTQPLLVANNIQSILNILLIQTDRRGVLADSRVPM